MRKHLFAALLLLSFPASALAEMPSTATVMLAKYGQTAPQLWGEAIPGVVTRLADTADTDERANIVALTLDACEGGTDMRIIALLRKHAVPATLFVTNRWLRQNQRTAEALAADPLFTFACHGKRHKPASVNGRLVFGIRGTRSIPALVEEVEDNVHAVNALTGKRPAWYRSGTAYYDDVAINIIHDLGLKIAGYTVSADAGATLPAGKVARLMLGAPKGAIILCHLNHPESETYAGLAKAIPAMLEKGIRFVPLGETEQ